MVEVQDDLAEKPTYTVDSTQHLPEALGLLKDWVTAVLQLETAIVGAIGAAFFLKNMPDVSLTPAQKIVLVIATSAFGLSIVFGVFLLNTLPGAAQRKPSNQAASNADLYSIFTIHDITIFQYTWWFRNTFFAGLSMIVVFVILRIVPF